MWQQFSLKKDNLALQYKEDRFEAGLSPEALRAFFEETDRAHAEESMTLRKAALMCVIMENARIEVREDELFPDKIEHMGLLRAHVRHLSASVLSPSTPPISGFTAVMSLLPSAPRCPAPAPPT